MGELLAFRVTSHPCLAGRSSILVLPVLMYGCEQWRLTETSLGQLDSLVGELCKWVLRLPKWFCNTPARICYGGAFYESALSGEKIMLPA